MPLSTPVLIGLVDNPRIGACDTTHREGGNVQLLPYCKVVANNERYKLIYWYDEGLGQPGTLDGGEEKKWELFDCELEPFEMINVYADPAYNEIRLQMMDDLDQKMAEIGDVPVHGDRL